MKLTTRQDIEAPLDFVYAQLTDFESFERMALRRGAEVERLDPSPSPDLGMGWRLQFPFRGKTRNVTLRMTELAPASLIGCEFESPMFEGQIRIDVIALAPRRTRMAITTDTRPVTMAARLLIQSVKLAKGRVQDRLDRVSARLAGMIEERARTTRG
ncbi:MAG: SRPBCC family protein [Rhodobacteraceae bacterium]|jgi:hypothetical protein|nr:SRPBCC family protein [Paracoccaceae bacterium]